MLTVTGWGGAEGHQFHHEEVGAKPLVLRLPVSRRWVGLCLAEEVRGPDGQGGQTIRA